MSDESRPEPREGPREPGAAGLEPGQRGSRLPAGIWRRWLGTGIVLLLILAALVLIRVTSCEPPPAAASPARVERVP